MFEKPEKCITGAICNDWEIWNALEIYINTFLKLFLCGLVGPSKSVLSRQDEDGIFEIELKNEEKVSEVVKETPSILDSSDLTRGLPVDFGITSMLQKVWVI